MFKKDFKKEMAVVLAHLLAQKLDPKGTDRVKELMEKTQR